MVIAQFNILPQEEIQRREQRMKTFVSCPLCEHQLSFEHRKESIAEINLVVEKATCGNCAVVLPETAHKLH